MRVQVGVVLKVTQEYCDVMVPRMLLLLSLGDTALPLSHKRAIAFSLSRILTRDGTPAMQAATSRIAFPTLHNPILHGMPSYHSYTHTLLRGPKG